MKTYFFWLVSVKKLTEILALPWQFSIIIAGFVNELTILYLFLLKIEKIYLRLFGGGATFSGAFGAVFFAPALTTVVGCSGVAAVVLLVFEQPSRPNSSLPQKRQFISGFEPHFLGRFSLSAAYWLGGRRTIM